MKLVGMKIILFWYELHTVVFAVNTWQFHVYTCYKSCILAIEIEWWPVIHFS